MSCVDVGEGPKTTMVQTGPPPMEADKTYLNPGQDDQMVSYSVCLSRFSNIVVFTLLWCALLCVCALVCMVARARMCV